MRVPNGGSVLDFSKSSDGGGLVIGSKHGFSGRDLILRKEFMDNFRRRCSNDPPPPCLHIEAWGWERFERHFGNAQILMTYWVQFFENTSLGGTAHNAAILKF